MDGVIGIIMNQSGGILLIKRKDIPLWCLPGGDVEKGESPKEAIVREIAEETGIHANTIKPIGTGRRPDFEARKEKNKKFICRLFICKDYKGRPRKGKGVANLQFREPKNLPSSLIRWHKEIITSFLKKNTPNKLQVDMKIKKELVWMLIHPLILYNFIKLMTFGKDNST